MAWGIALILAVLALAWLALAGRRYAAMVRFRTTIGARARAFLEAQGRAGHLDYEAWAGAQATQPRGIVICAGGRDMLGQAYTNLDALRSLHGCTLPIELFHVGAAELPRETRLALEREFAPLRCLDVTRLEPLPGHERPARLAGYQLKAFALAWCSFDQVLLLDADNVPLEDPTALFELEPFRVHGSLFWPDIALMSTLVEHPRRHRHLSLRDGRNPNQVQSFNPRILDYLGLPRPATRERLRYEYETGQALLDRRRVWPAIHMTWWVNARSRHFYLYMHGDTGTYHLGFGLAGIHCEQVSLPAYHAGVVQDGVFKAKVYLQRDPGGRVILYHQTKRKTNVDARWLPITHYTTDPPADHPRERKQRDSGMRAPVSALHDLQALDGAPSRVEEFLQRSHARLVARQEELRLPAPPRRRLLQRRILPW